MLVTKLDNKVHCLENMKNTAHFSHNFSVKSLDVLWKKEVVIDSSSRCCRWVCINKISCSFTKTSAKPTPSLRYHESFKTGL